MKMLRRIRIYLVFYENEYNCSEICILLRMQRIRKGIFMLQMLYPDEYLDSTYTIDFKKLYKEGCFLYGASFFRWRKEYAIQTKETMQTSELCKFN